MQLNSLETPLQQDHVLINKASDYLDNVLMRIREISNNLMPQALIRKGLTTALQEFINELNSHGNLQIKLFHSKTVYVNKEKEIHIYRIIQEIINNVLKHAAATEMSVNIDQTHIILRLQISDNGCGFLYTAITPDNIGLGLKNIVSRVDIMKGDLYLESSPGKGTHYTIEIPL